MSESSNRWVLGARPRTLPAALVPVMVGCGLANSEDNLVWWKALLALIVALSLQVGVNYANDYSDGVRGTDAVRVGPARLVGSGLAEAAEVKRAAFISFAIAAVAGLVLAVPHPWLIAVGLACIAAAWFYTGGRRPYGYSGFGELAVFVFFGLVATAGTAYVQTGHFKVAYFLAGSAVGCLAVALLIVNNLRDLPTDAAVNKRTLAVRIGDRYTRFAYVAFISFPFLFVVLFAGTNPWVLMALAAIVLRMDLSRRVLRGDTGPALIDVLKGTGRLQLIFGVLFAAGLAL